MSITVTDAQGQCSRTTSSGLQCQLLSGHVSAHAARDGEALISWRNWDAGDSGNTVTMEWFAG
jgi:hypothetical protein